MRACPWQVCDADWNHWPDGLPDADIWAVVAGAGFDGVEVGVYSAAVELAPPRLEIRTRLAAEHRLPVRAVLLSLPADRWPHGALTGPVELVAAEAGECAAGCARLGLDTLGLWPGADPAGASWARLVAGLRQVRDAAAGHGVRVAVEYKPGTVVSSAEDAIRLAADVPGTGVLLDTGHAWAGGEDPAECVRRLGELLWHVHLGDAADGAPDDDLPLGRVHDVGPLLAALAETGYAGAASLDLYGAVSAGLCTGAQAGAESLRALAAVTA